MRMSKAAVVTALLAPLASFAQSGAAQPDTSSATTYIAAGVATIAAVYAAGYAMDALGFVAKWVKKAVGR